MRFVIVTGLLTFLACASCARTRPAVESESLVLPAVPVSPGAPGEPSSAPHAVAGAAGSAAPAGPVPAPSAPAPSSVPVDTDGEEVWIGDLWSTQPWLCDLDMDSFIEPPDVRPEGYVEPVVLVLEGARHSELTGVIALGRGEIPEDAADAPYDSLNCTTQLPTKGGVYTLMRAARTADRLTFEIVPSEIWDDDVLAVCPECFGVGGSERIDLVVRDDMMQGTLGARAELRLRRMP